MRKVEREGAGCGFERFVAEGMVGYWYKEKVGEVRRGMSVRWRFVRPDRWVRCCMR